MGARQSRRSVDITTTPKKEGAPAEGGVVGDAAAPGDGKLERIEEADSKPTSNGVAPHTDAADDKEKDKDEANEKDKEKQQEEVKSEEAKPESGAESPAEGGEVTTPTEAGAVSPNTATSPESKETKKKDKVKKRWSFRSISFTKKDKSKPAREDAPKNGDVTKEEPLAEGCEEAENATASSPTEEKSAASSPTEGESATAPAVTETKEEKAASPAEEKNEDAAVAAAAVAAAPVTAEDKKEESAAAEKVEADKKAAVEVSPREVAADPREVSASEVQQVAAPSIIERKTSEDLPPPLPSSPPPTPIDPSPLQQAQQAAASATALAEALKLPAEAENDDPIPPIQQSSTPPPSQPSQPTPSSSSCDRPQNPETPAPLDVPSTANPTATPVDEPTIQSTFVSAKESLPVVDRDTEEMEKASETLPEPDVIPQKPFIPEKNVESDGNAMPSEPAASVQEQVIAEEGAKEEMKPPQEVIVEEIVEELPDVPLAQDAPTQEFKENVIEPETKDEVVEEVVLDEDNEIVIEPSDMVVDSEEGPVPVSDTEIVVEAKPAVVIPDEVVEEIQDAEMDDSKADNTDSVEVILDTDEEKIELESDTAMPTEEIAVSDIEPEEVDMEPPCELPCEMPDRPVTEETIVIVETPSKKEIIEIEELEVPNMPPPPPMESPEKSVNESEPERPVEIEQSLPQETKSEETDTVPSCPLPEKEKPMPTESPVLPESQSTEADTCPIENKSLKDCPDEVRAEISSCPAENLPDPSDDLLPPAPVETLNADSFEYPLPPEELSCPYVPSKAPVVESELPDPVEGDSNSRNPTETLLTPPTSPSPQSNVSIASNATATTTATRESSQLRLHEDDSNREFNMESVSLSLNSYDDSQVDSKERLAESLAETGDQEETAVSCRLSNGTASPIAVQENHQSTPAEAEAPVENNVAAHETSMTESADEAPKVAPPTVPVEAPVAPPAAPTITEDVASVTKAIEEIDISDKAVAAAVNEAIECNTNEIVADAPYQNSVNE